MPSTTKCMHSFIEESSPAWPLLSDSSNMTKCVPCQHIKIQIEEGKKSKRKGRISPNKNMQKIKVEIKIGKMIGKSMSEALIFASTNPQYDNKLFIDLQVQYMKIPRSEHVENMRRTCCLHVLPMFSPCSHHVLSLEFSCIELANL